MSLLIALVVLAEMWHAAARVAHGANSPWLDWLVLVVAIYSVLSVLVLLPFVVIPRDRERAENFWLLLRLATAIAPFLVAFASYVSGAHSWVMGVGFASSATLLAVTFLRPESDATL